MIWEWNDICRHIYNCRMQASKPTLDLVVQRPAGPARQLFLLFHGINSGPVSMRAVAMRLAAEFPEALVVCVAGPRVTADGRGRFWFESPGWTDDQPIDGAPAALPGFIAAIRDWQRESGVSIAATALVGFSQGAILSLEALKRESDIAGRVVAFAGRFVDLPERPFPYASVHLIHGTKDDVIPSARSLQAAERLMALGSDVTADVLPGSGHSVDAAQINIAIERLKGHVPQWMWKEALRSAHEMRDASGERVRDGADAREQAAANRQQLH